LEINIELSFVEINKSFETSNHFIVRGNSLKHNYLVTNTGFYSLKNSYPFPILKDKNYLIESRAPAMRRNEYKVTKEF
jgi:hypothetical protein